MATQQEQDELLKAMLARELAQSRLGDATEAPRPQYGQEAISELRGGYGQIDAEAKAQRDNYLREQLAARVQDADLGMIGVGGAAAARFGKQDPSHFVKQMNTTENQDLAKARNADFQGWLKGKEGRMEGLADTSMKAGQIDATTYNARLDALQMAAQSATGAEKARLQAQIDQAKNEATERQNQTMAGIAYGNLGVSRGRLGLESSKTEAEITKLLAEAARAKAEASGKKTKPLPPPQQMELSKLKAARDYFAKRFAEIRAIQKSGGVPGVLKDKLGGVMPDSIPTKTNISKKAHAAPDYMAMKAMLGDVLGVTEAERLLGNVPERGQFASETDAAEKEIMGQVDQKIKQIESDFAENYNVGDTSGEMTAPAAGDSTDLEGLTPRQIELLRQAGEIP